MGGVPLPLKSRQSARGRQGLGHSITEHRVEPAIYQRLCAASVVQPLVNGERITEADKQLQVSWLLSLGRHTLPDTIDGSGLRLHRTDEDVLAGLQSIQHLAGQLAVLVELDVLRVEERSARQYVATTTFVWVQVLRRDGPNKHSCRERVLTGTLNTNRLLGKRLGLLESRGDVLDLVSLNLLGQGRQCLRGGKLDLLIGQC